MITASIVVGIILAIVFAGVYLCGMIIRDLIKGFKGFKTTTINCPNCGKKLKFIPVSNYKCSKCKILLTSAKGELIFNNKDTLV